MSAKSKANEPRMQLPHIATNLMTTDLAAKSKLPGDSIARYPPQKLASLWRAWTFAAKVPALIKLIYWTIPQTESTGETPSGRPKGTAI